MAEITQLLIHWLRAFYLIEITTLEPLALGADANAAVYKAKSVDTQVYFVKVRQGPPAEAPIEVITLLQNEGIKELISPIKTREGHQTLHVENLMLTVYPFVEGENGFTRTLTDEQWILFGKALRKIHEIPMPKAVEQRIRRESFSTKWRDSVRSIMSAIEGDCDEIGAKFSAYLKEHAGTIADLVSRSEKLSKKIKGQSFPFVLCHSDIHAGNLLLTNEGGLFLIDWDDPLMAPRERDLMFIGGGVGNVWNNSREETLFYQGYGETELNPALLAYYRHERILEDIVDFAEGILLNNSSLEDKNEMYGHFLGMFEPNGVVDIALQADEAIVE
ncbi:aminoglycoside phosphotransferase family protein [Estrella lausannensis]|uniref:Aminoglycoside phosphotransferase n=1 Tax=Estrella lausannensis TaxID=483423 RepID=A0A0H5DP65_9BACT|nr:aminoglycoside phosphotransferase family protein [Estrella lausannensis]CRX38291.1 Aminoglycoside phosphotransferase [Estrella lausannensis]